MNIPSLLQIQETINEANEKQLSTLKGLVLQNFTFQPIEFCLKYQLLDDKFLLHIQHGGYDNIYQDSLNQELLKDTSLDFILVALYLPNFSKILFEDFSSASQQQIADERLRIENFMSEIVKNVRRYNDAPILIFNYTFPFVPALGIYDQRELGGQISSIQRLNNHLLELSRKSDMVYAIDINHCLLRVGYYEAMNWRYWKMLKMPFSHRMQFEISLEISKYLRSFQGKAKKCLVLDCDNVLWGGILGEVGWKNVEIGAEGSGSPYYLLQKEVINLYNKGVLIAICSKNNESDVRECFQQNGDMLIQEKHIVSMQINWENKASNIEKIANDLNINLDSIVFIDDSRFEIELINSLLPQVSTIQASQSAPEINHQLLANSGFFEATCYTLEDKKRSVLYKEDQVRKSYFQSGNDMVQYLRSLEMKMTVSPLTEKNLSRACQLTQRTNQFNLTAHKYSILDLEKLMSVDSCDVIMLQLADKFGSYGDCGMAIISYQLDSAVLELFLLSCRVLGRKVEHAFLNECLLIASNKGAEKIVAEYNPTKKNSQCSKFYLNCGFSKVNENLFEMVGVRDGVMIEDCPIKICNEFNLFVEEK